MDELFQNRRIVILGPAAGKSSLGNTIFREKRFKIGHTFNSETRQCQVETKSVNGRSITLIDTPGFFDTDRSEEELKPEIVRCITECAPGPHAFLIVLKVEKFTEHEQAVITKMCQYFSEEIFKYAIVVFTHGDQLPEGQIIEEYVLQNGFMSNLVAKCGSRCHVIDNKYWNQNTKDEYRNNQFQVEELLKSIDKIIEANKGHCYTNDRQAKVSILKKLLSRLAYIATVALSSTYSIIYAAVGLLIRKVTRHNAIQGTDTPQEASKRAAEAEKNKSDLGQIGLDD
ncbi:GTPase IMAP family member 7-like isoform X2 [Dicentrarchus labrax]|uniref:AIG1-type G domain-containing protein n=1 Tax=Dicentrarchus labrax TaxID=13489 RepID=A0A8P4K1J3_DICLA|nr:GTPase IMAP family member 7-like isoform X1 [Dicentrarchus labrax]XP_051258461.1 GTPase IMAP family member 7-like isoform X2 [Dicentrarchus labrax]